VDLAVAVGANDYTFIHLDTQPFNPRRPRLFRTDIKFLFSIGMMKVQAYRILLAAEMTGMFGFVVSDERKLSGTIRSLIGDVLLSVSRIPLFAYVSRMLRSTVFLQM